MPSAKPVQSIAAAGLVLVFSGCGKRAPEQPAEAPVAPPTPAAVQPAPALSGGDMPKGTTSVLIRHEVADFDRWKASFDVRSAARAEASVVWHSVSRSSENDNLVIVHLIATDATKLEAMMSSDELKTAMAAAGVAGKPQIITANDVEITSPGGKTDAPTGSVFVSHEVGNFDNWKAAFDADAVNRAALGIVGGSVSREVASPNRILVHFMVTDTVKVAEALASDEMKARMKEAGVKGAPQIWLASDVEISTYAQRAPAH
jgi:hypothetical protein